MGLLSKFKKGNAQPDDPIADDSTEDSLPEDQPKKSAAKKKAKKEKKETAVAGGGGAKQFLVDHVEKIGLGAVAVCLLLMIWSAVGRERLPSNRSPNDLQARVTSRSQEIEVSELPKISATSKRYSEQIQAELAPIDSTIVSNLSFTPDDIIISPQKATKRGDPKLLAPEDPIAVAGVGLFAVYQARDLLGVSFQDRERIRLEKEAESQQLKEQEEARLLREKRAKEKAERDSKKKASSRDRKKQQEEEERRARAQQSREPEKKEWPLPAELASKGFQVQIDPKSREQIASAGRIWVVVNAKAPRYKQQKEFDAAFLGAVGHNSLRDRPEYPGMRIARLEVAENAGNAPLDWSKAKEWTFGEQINAFKDERRAWVGEAQPVIADVFFDSKLTQPLGPLLMDSWEKWAAHPDVMLKGQESTMEPLIEAPEIDNQQPENKEANTDPFQLGESVNELEGTGRSRQPSPVRTSPRSTREPTSTGMGIPSRDGMSVELSELGAFYQIRVFDFTVEPGKRYRYRVQLAIRNPNSATYGMESVPPAFLANPQSRDTPWKATDWSEPTELVVVPIGQRAFAGTVNLPDEDDDFDESYATVVTRVINFGKGTVTTALFDVYRGGMVSGITKGFEIDPITKMVKRQDDSLIETDLLLLDMRGGPQSRDEQPGLAVVDGRPAEMLFLDSKGNLHVRSELTDADEMITYRMVAGEDVSVGGGLEGLPPGVNPLIPIPGVGVPNEPGQAPDDFNIWEQDGRRR